MLHEFYMTDEERERINAIWKAPVNTVEEQNKVYDLYCKVITDAQQRYLDEVQGNEERIMADAKKIIENISKEQFDKFAENIKMSASFLPQDYTHNTYENALAYYEEWVSLSLQACKRSGISDEPIRRMIENKIKPWYEVTNLNPKQLKMSKDIISKTILETGGQKERQINAAQKPKKGSTKKVALIAYVPDNATISRPITRYDLLCMSAVYSLMLEADTTGEDIIISPRQVFSLIGGGDRFNESDQKKIIDSLDTLRKANVVISNDPKVDTLGDKAESAVYPKRPRFYYETYMLKADKIRGRYYGNEIFAYKIHPKDLPVLCKIAEDRKQLIAVKPKLLQINGLSRTVANVTLVAYWVQEIAWMKNSNHASPRRLWQTVNDACKRSEKERRTTRETTREILDHFIKMQYIKSYKFDKMGVDIEV